MRIDSRLTRIEREMGIDQSHRPFVLVLSAGPHEDDPEYEARLRQRIEGAIRRRPNEKFIMLM